MEKDRKLLINLVTRELLTLFNMDYYHIDKYDTPKVDKYNLGNVEGSLLALTQDAENCANIISSVRNIFEKGNYLEEYEKHSFMLHPNVQEVIKQFNPNNCMEEDVTEFDLGSKYKVKTVLYNDEVISLEYKTYHPTKRSIHTITTLRDFEDTKNPLEGYVYLKIALNRNTKDGILISDKMTALMKHMEKHRYDFDMEFNEGIL